MTGAGVVSELLVALAATLVAGAAVAVLAWVLKLLLKQAGIDLTTWAESETGRKVLRVTLVWGPTPVLAAFAVITRYWQMEDSGDMAVAILMASYAVLLAGGLWVVRRRRMRERMLRREAQTKAQAFTRTSVRLGHALTVLNWKRLEFCQATEEKIAALRPGAQASRQTVRAYEVNLFRRGLREVVTSLQAMMMKHAEEAYGRDVGINVIYQYVDRKNNVLMSSADYCAMEEAWYPRMISDDEQVPIGGWCSGRVAMTRSAEVWDDVRVSDAYEQRHVVFGLKEPRYKALACVPVVVTTPGRGRTCVGVLNVSATQAGFFTTAGLEREALLSIVEPFAVHIAMLYKEYSLFEAIDGKICQEVGGAQTCPKVTA